MYLYWGKVKRGKKRGRKLGFPTANLCLHKKIPEGVYISKVKIGGKVHQSVTFIGAAKTFGEQNILGETFIFNFDKNIYGKWISVKLIKKLRGNMTFNSAGELSAQISRDRSAAMRFFGTSFTGFE